MSLANVNVPRTSVVVNSTPLIVSPRSYESHLTHQVSIAPLASHPASLHTSHEPLGALPVDRDETTNQLVIFREPRARVVSAFDNNMHSYGNLEEHEMIKETCAKNVTCYAARPGQLVSHCGTHETVVACISVLYCQSFSHLFSSQGCMLRMLTAATCSVPAKSPHTMSSALQTSPEFQERLRMGKAAIQSMAFIGLTEEWNESLCRFHKQFGGRPRQAQFQNIRKGSKKSSVADLSPTYKDPADEAIYQFAREEFDRRITEQGGRCYQFLERPAGEMDGDTTSGCVARTCAEMGKQCGEWPDGCGGIRICGICSMEKRDSLPETWRLQCSPEGACIRTCPPWEEAGLWNRPFQDVDDSKLQEEKWRSNLKGAPEAAVSAAISKGDLHLFPTDAILMCVGACTRQDEPSLSFASKYCICGETPTDFLHIAPTAAEYQDIYNLMPAVHVFKSKPYKATLRRSETQPKCCPPKEKMQQDEKGILPPRNTWRKGIPLADFYQAYYLGCGSRPQCEKLGHAHGASVVSYDSEHHFCYLGRTHRTEVDDVLDHETRYHLVLSSP